MEEKAEEKPKDKKKERIKVLLIMGIIISLALIATAIHLDICACWEEGRFSEKITFQIGETQQIKGTDYSLRLVDAKSSVNDAVFIEIYNNSEYVNETLLFTGNYARDERCEIENFIVILKEVTNERIATFSIYFI